MKATDETRKQWESLLPARGDLHSMALGTWLGLAAMALGADPSQTGMPSWHEPRAATSPQASRTDSADVREEDDGRPQFNPFAAMTQSFEAWQRLAQAWFEPQGENPLARWFAHPAAVIDTGNSPTRLMMESGLAFGELLRRAFGHEVLRLQGWTTALQRFAEEFNSDAESPVVIDSLDGLFTHWSKVGEEALQKHSRSDAFLQSQADMLNKSMRFRLAQRRTIEAVSRSMDVPTLTDLDEAFAAIHALKAETRRLRRLVEAKVPPVVVPPTERPTRKTTTARRARSAA